MAKTTKAHLRLMPTLAKDSVHLPQPVPRVDTPLEVGFDLTPIELEVIRTAMVILAASRKPKLTWVGWKHLAVAISIGSERAQKEAKTKNLKDYKYRMLMRDFLKKTGFNFIPDIDRSRAVRMLPIWEDVSAWRDSLSTSRRGALTSPRDIWTEYHKDLDGLGKPSGGFRPRSGGKRSSAPTLLEQYDALLQAYTAMEEQRDRAEERLDYMAELMQEIATRANMTPEQIAKAHNDVLAKRSPVFTEGQPPEDDED